MRKYSNLGAACLWGMITLGICSCHAGETASHRFDFGTEKAASGCRSVTPETVYSDERGYGFDLGSHIALTGYGDYVNGPEPFFFSVALPAGNYSVRIKLAGGSQGSVVTVKPETRRLMVEQVRIPPNGFSVHSLAVNIRTPAIAGGGRVRLKDREAPYLHWDEKLTLEFNGTNPCIAAVEIRPANDVTTLYIAGDSTVCDQPGEPWNSWGQMLPRFLKPEVAVANHAESGESIRSSLGAGRFDQIFSTMKPGDYLFVQFGHNDMKSKSPAALETYRKDLKNLVSETRKHKATPVLITSMERKTGARADTLGDYPDTVRAVAAEEGVALIDLHAMSKELYKALGPDLGKAFVDGTHHNAYGSYQLAQCVVEGIRLNKLELVDSVVDDLPRFDPSQPDSLATFAVPPSPVQEKEKPEGN